MTVSFKVDNEGANLIFRIHGGTSDSATKLVPRFRLICDVDAVPRDINRVLLLESVMAGLVSDAPGLWLPKAFDVFELPVCTIVVQHISVKGLRRSWAE